VRQTRCPRRIAWQVPLTGCPSREDEQAVPADLFAQAALISCRVSCHCERPHDDGLPSVWACVAGAFVNKGCATRASSFASARNANGRSFWYGARRIARRAARRPSEPASGAERTPTRTARSAVSSDPPSAVPKVKGSRVESIQARSDQDCQTAPTITEVVSQRPSAPATTLARAVQDRLHKPL